MSGVAHWNVLPVELWDAITCYLPFHDAQALSQQNRFFRLLLKPRIWRGIVIGSHCDRQHERVKMLIRYPELACHVKYLSWSNFPTMESDCVGWLGPISTLSTRRVFRSLFTITMKTVQAAALQALPLLRSVHTLSLKFSSARTSLVFSPSILSCMQPLQGLLLTLRPSQLGILTTCLRATPKVFCELRCLSLTIWPEYEAPADPMSVCSQKQSLTELFAAFENTLVDLRIFQWDTQLSVSGLIAAIGDIINLQTFFLYHQVMYPEKGVSPLTRGDRGCFNDFVRRHSRTLRDIRVGTCNPSDDLRWEFCQPLPGPEDDRTLAIEKFSLLGLEHTQSTTFLPTNLSCFSHSLLHLYLSGKPLQAKEATKLITSLRGGNQASALLQSLRIPVEEMSIGLFDCLYTNLKCLRTLAVAYLPTPGFHEHAEHEKSFWWQLKRRDYSQWRIRELDVIVIGHMQLPHLDIPERPVVNRDYVAMWKLKRVLRSVEKTGPLRGWIYRPWLDVY